jgi:hypothetical protein
MAMYLPRGGFISYRTMLVRADSPETKKELESVTLRSNVSVAKKNSGRMVEIKG